MTHMTVDDILREARAMSTPEMRKQLVLEFRDRVNAARGALALVDIPDQELMEHCKHLVQQLPSIDGAWVSIVDGTEQHIRAAYGAEHVLRLTGQTTPLANSFCAQVVADLEPILAPDVQLNPMLRVCAVSRDFAGYAGVPLQFRGATVGAMALSARKNTLTEAVMPVLEKEAHEVEQKISERDRRHGYDRRHTTRRASDELHGGRRIDDVS